jgi:A/G-specific adenine glycosylase
MGYYARARNLHHAAQILAKEHHGIFPEEKNLVQTLPGIGPYTAAAILSIAFNQPWPVLDGNVNRVLCRTFRIAHQVKSPAGKKLLEEIALTLLAKKRPGDFNQALMELGATVCTPVSPKCTRCPVNRLCQANRYREQSLFPTKVVAKPKPHYNIAAGIIWHNEHILIARRPEKGLLGGLWEFPGGKVLEQETLESAVVREIKEELDVTVTVEKRIDRIAHQYTHFTITLYVFECRYVSGEPKAIGCSEWRWVEPYQLSDYAFPRANGKIIDNFFKHEKIK